MDRPSPCPENAGANSAVDPSERALLVAAEQARRDRGRLMAARIEATALRRRVEDLERSPSRRIFTPARWTIQQLLPLARAFRPAPAPVPAHVPAPVPAPGRGRGLALVIDDEWPRPDRDSGSMDIVNLLAALRRLGFDARLAAAAQHAGPQPERERLEAAGLRCLRPEDAPTVADWIRTHGAAVDLCVLCRVFCGGAFLEQVEQDCRFARLVFNTVDLNFLREERRAHLLKDAALAAAVDGLRERELHVVRRCDATIVVSDVEAALLTALTPACNVVQLPLARPLRPPVTPFEGRSGIGFIGGFAHAPNVDAVRFFLRDVWPLVCRDLPDCELTIVGADAPSDLLAGSVGPVRLLGHLPDIGSWLEQLRLTVAPLRFGAGAKGKIASSLAAGVPCIATPVAVEGMALGGGVVVGATPEQFATAIRDTYTSAARWHDLSGSALSFARGTLSEQAWQDRLDAMLGRLGL